MDCSHSLAGWRRRGGLLVRYEDVILRPEDELDRILEYVSLDRGPGVIKSMVLEAESTPNSLQAAHRTSQTPARSIGRWRQDLRPELVLACNDAFGDLLDEMGYELSS